MSLGYVVPTANAPMCVHRMCSLDVWWRMLLMACTCLAPCLLAGASVLPTLSDRVYKGLLWWTLIIFTTVFVTYQYLVLMFWHPAAHFYQDVWPYTLTARAQYFYLSLGDAVRGYQLVPDVIALIMLCTSVVGWCLVKWLADTL